MKRSILPVALLACTALSCAMLPSTASAAERQSAAARSAISLDDGWRFHQGDAGEAPAAPAFDDQAWSKVSVPHTWNTIGDYTLVRKTPGTNYQGVGWYRLTVKGPERAPGTRQYLDFAAVGKIADVWVNGIKVGRHEGAFSRFRFDVTDAIVPGRDNVIAVRADNSRPSADNATGQVIPLSGDFFVNGGIYRGVQLVTVAEAGVDMLDYGGPGVYARSLSVDDDKATIAVLTRLRNQSARTRKLMLTTVISDASGKEVARGSASVRIKPGTAESTATLAVPSPHLWNGRADPYLYSVRVEVASDGGPADRVTVPLGIRSFRFDADKGFFLNGSHVKLHGVSRHQDRLGKGWGLSREDHAEDMALIVELGANTVRQAHYQHADEWSDEADRAGMVVWAELPYVTTPSLSGGKGSDALWANAETQLRELIRQDYNHPSIVTWSVGNEVDSAKGFGVGGEPPKPLALLKHLNALAKQEDPSRPTAFADCCEGLSMIQTAGEQLAGTTDLVGYNRYFGWYMPNPLDVRAQLGAELDKLHGKHPTLPLSISEYGAGGAPSQHSDNVRTGFVNMAGRPQPEEFQSFVHEQSWPAIRERDFVFASWVWNMFDFPSDFRDEGDSVDLNTKGLVTYDRKVRKDAFYYYKAQWNPEPMIHLTGKRYDVRAYPVMDVRAYSNAAKATLTINGKSIGEAPCKDRICSWDGVALAPGANRAVVRGQVGATLVEDTMTWTGPDPLRQGLAIDAGELAGRVVAGRRYGSDNFVEGGKPSILNLEGFGRKAADPRKVETDTPGLFEYWREGTAFSYAVPVPNGRWKVTVLTFEPSRTPSADATMTISANGRPVVPAFNIAKAAGGPLKALTRTFTVQARDGLLKLDFAGQAGNAVVAAITIDK